MKNLEYSINGTSLIAESKDLVCFDSDNKFICSNSGLKNNLQMREFVLNHEQLNKISHVNFRNKKYTISQVYSKP